jgi:hypothetical protein
MDAGLASIIIAFIQLLAKMAEKQGLTLDEIDALFRTALGKARANEPILLPDAVLPSTETMSGEREE